MRTLARFLCLFLAFAAASVGAAQEAQNPEGQPLADFSWDGDGEQKGADFKKLTRQQIAALSGMDQAIGLLHELSLPPQGRMILANAILDQFGSDFLCEEINRLGWLRQKGRPVWSCVELAAYGASIDDPGTVQFFDRLLDLRPLLKENCPFGSDSEQNLHHLSFVLMICLGSAGDAAHASVGRAVKSQDPVTRAVGAYFIGFLVIDSLAGELPRLFKDQDLRVRTGAFFSAQALREKDFAKPLAEALFEGLVNEADSFMMEAILEALGPVAGVEEFPHIIEMMQRHPDESVRADACAACRFGGQSCVDALIALLEPDESTIVRQAAVDALLDLHHPDGHRALRALAKREEGLGGGSVDYARWLKKHLQESIAIAERIEKGEAEQGPALDARRLEELLVEFESGQIRLNEHVRLPPDFPEKHRALKSWVRAEHLPRLRQAFTRACRLPASLWGMRVYSPALIIWKLILTARHRSAEAPPSNTETSIQERKDKAP